MNKGAVGKMFAKGWIRNIGNERIKYFDRPERRQVAGQVLKICGDTHR